MSIENKPYNHSEFIEKLETKRIFSPSGEQKRYDRVIALNDNTVVAILWDFDQFTSVKDYDCYDQDDIDSWNNDHWYYMGVCCDLFINGVKCAVSSLWGIESFAVFFDGTYSKQKYHEVNKNRLQYERDQIAETLAELERYKANSIDKYDHLVGVLRSTDFNALADSIVLD